MRDAALEVVDVAGWYNSIPGALAAHGGPLRSPQQAMQVARVLTATEEWEAQRQRFATLPGATIWIPMFVTVGRRPG